MARIAKSDVRPVEEIKQMSITGKRAVDLARALKAAAPAGDE